MALRKSEPEQIVVVRRRRSRKHDIPHGGWKVAYADFVTAMMAFFLLLWLVNSTDPEQAEQLSNYFNPYQAEDDSKEVDITAGIISIMDGGQRAGSEITPREQSDQNIEVEPQPKTEEEEKDLLSWDTVEISREEYEQLKSLEKQKSSEPEESRPVSEEFREIARQIESMKSEIELLGEYKDILRVDEVTTGLRVQFVDQDEFSMFERGGSQLNGRARAMIETFGGVIQQLPHKIAIVGHTDATPFRGSGSFSNWELSADRANAARRALLASGVEADQIFRIEGKAAIEPLYPEDPRASQNRRISFLILR